MKKPLFCSTCGQLQREPSGAELRALREAGGATQDDVARGYGCVRPFVSLVECGKRPAPEALIRYYVETFAEPFEPVTPILAPAPWNGGPDPNDIPEDVFGRRFVVAWLHGEPKLCGWDRRLESWRWVARDLPTGEPYIPSHYQPLMPPRPKGPPPEAS